MKVAFIYGPMSLGARPLDFARLYDDPRGLTGSELSCVEYAREMGRRGHDVTLFVCQGEAPGLNWRISNDLSDDEEYIRVEFGMSSLVRLAEPGVWDAICVWNEPDLLRCADPRAVRLVNQQLNDFTYCRSGFVDHVDVFTSPSAHHLAFIGPQAPGTFDPPTGDSKIWATNGWNKWRVLPNGCDPTLYSDGHRVPGRVLWASSPDRGLHLLLQAWPLIRERVPGATLHCLYNFAPGALLGYEEGSIGLNGLPVTPDIQELARRYRFIQYAMKRLEGMGVVQRGSVSRKGVVAEMDEAVCLAYPCDTIRYTEGFSVTTMEACAAGLVPVISDEDALGSIYGKLPGVLPSPISKHMDAFVKMVTAALTPVSNANTDFFDLSRQYGRSLAAAHAWPVLAERLEAILQGEVEKKRADSVETHVTMPSEHLVYEGELSPTDVAKLRAYAETRYDDPKADGGSPIGVCLWGSGTSHEMFEAIKKSTLPPTGIGVIAQQLVLPGHDRWTFAHSHPTGAGCFDYVKCGQKSPQGFACKEREGHAEMLGTDHCTYRGPYEVEGNPVPEGARLAEWYVNHRGFGHTIMRYWITDNIMVGGSIYDAAEWAYLKKRYGLTDVLNVEVENSDKGKGIEREEEDDYLFEHDRQRDDGTPRSVETMVEIVTWAKNANPGAKFYVHCTHGGSRSPAYAYLLARALGGLTREEALACIRRTRPEYGTAQFPNHVQYLKDADEALLRVADEERIMATPIPAELLAALSEDV